LSVLLVLHGTAHGTAHGVMAEKKYINGEQLTLRRY